MTEAKLQTPKLNAIPAEELLDTTYAPTRALIDGLMRQGLYLLSGASKIGKSWLVLWLANQISRGEPVWNLKTERCSVLYISLEDTFQRIQKRLNEVSGGNPGNVWLANEATFIGGGLEEQLENFITEHPGIGFVIIDTLQRVRKAGQEQYNYASDYEAIGALKKIADRYLITILLVHHTNKNKPADPFDKISGTTALMGSADGAFVLSKSSRMENTATLDATGREFPDSQLNLRFDKQRKIWEFVSFGNEAEKSEPNPILLALQSFIRERHEWDGFAAELLEELKSRGEVDAEPHTLTRLMNANIAELASDYGVLYRSGKRTGKGRKVYLRDVSTGRDKYVANVANDAFSDTETGTKNSYNSYITVIDGPEGA